VSSEETFHGVGLRPLSPCQVRASRDASGLLLRWTRRTRIGGDSWEGLDVPLAEESEAYQVDVLDGASVKRTYSVSTPTLIYPLADQVSDWGTPPAVCRVKIYQVSPSYGRGAQREAMV
jgi:hypothetical protein